jgi:hypothetical protein
MSVSNMDIARRGSVVTGHAPSLIVGKIYRLKFPGIAARVIEAPPGGGSPDYPYLVESLFLRSRWYVNALGEPDNINSPLMLVPVGSQPHAEVSEAGERNDMVCRQ